MRGARGLDKKVKELSKKKKHPKIKKHNKYFIAPPTCTHKAM